MFKSLLLLGAFLVAGMNGRAHGAVNRSDLPVASFTATTVCQGLPTVFTNNSSTASGSIVANIWDFGDGHGSTVPNPRHVYAQSGTFSVTLTVINSQSDVAEYTSLVTVHPSGNLNYLVSSPNNCVSSNFTFTNLSNIVSGSFTSYSWDFGDGTVSTGVNASHHYTNHGTYTVTLTTLTNQNCNNTFSRTLEVYPEAVVNFIKRDVCEQEKITFTNTTQVATGNVQYAWSFGDGESSQEVHPSHQFGNAATYTVSLTATTEKGCTTGTTKNVTVHHRPVADFTVADHCFGSPLVVTNTSSIPAGQLNYSWKLGDGTTSADEQPVYTYKAIGTYAVSLLVTSDQGCKAEAFHHVGVSPKPIVNFSFRNVCSGEATEFNNQSSIAIGNLTYVWDFGDGESSSDINPVYAYDEPGNYTVVLDAFASSGGCSSQIIKQVQVRERPVARFTTKDNCLDSAIVFKNTSVYSGNDIAYQWELGDGSRLTDHDVQHRYPTAQTYTVTLKALSHNGCSDAYSHPVKVLALPVANFLSSPVCDGTAMSFRNFTTITSGTVSYEWDFGDQSKATDHEPSHRYNAPGNYTVKLTASTGGGCTVVKEQDVSVYPLPVADFEAGNVCDDKPVDFINRSNVVTGEIVSYLWDFGDQTNAVITNPKKEFLKDGTYTVRLTATTDKNCKSTVQKNVTIYPSPVAGFDVQDVCVRQAVQVQNKSSIESGSMTFYWDFGDQQNSIAESPSHLYSGYGVYTITLVATSGNGCQDSYQRAVAVFSAPHVNAGDDRVISKGYSTPLQASGGLHYTWQPIDGLSNSHVANPLATPLTTTTYRVTTRDSFGCESTDSVTVYVKNDFRIVASNVLTPDENGKNDTWVIENIETFGDVHVRVYNRWGRLVFEQEGYKNDWKGISGGDYLPDGTYYYHIIFSSSDQVYKGALTILRNRSN
jgi:gliding motility-associated-like protein